MTLVGLSLPALLGGSVLVETIFAWNGIGLLTIQAVEQRDYTLVLGATLMLALLTMLANLLADVMYAVLDPRIRYE
jgi:peptide/nickel transport system permease protein